MQKILDIGYLNKKKVNTFVEESFCKLIMLLIIGSFLAFSKIV